MSDVFEVGQRVRHGSYGEGVITYGPYKSTFGEDAYLVRREDGIEKTWFGRFISVIPTPPAFAVGDTVKYEYGTGGKLVAGPFRSEYHDEPIWVVEKPNGTHMTPTQNSLTKVEASAVKVGDRVRVVEDSDGYRSGEYVGMVGTLERIDEGADLAHLVRFGDGSGIHGDKDNGRWWCERVEPVADEDTYEHDGVIYDLTAKYRDREDDPLRIALVDGVARVSWFGGTPRFDDDTLEEAVATWGPFTLVTD